MTVFKTQNAATKAARDAGFQDGEFTVSKGEEGWTYAANEPAKGEQDEAQSGDQTGNDGADQEQLSGGSEPAGEPAPQTVTVPKVTFPATVFPTVDHAIAWAKCDGFAKNRIKVEQVEGGFLFRPLAEGERYMAIGSVPRTGNGPAFPAPGTKKRILIDMVCRAEGASMEELETAVGWKKCSGTLNELDEAFGLDIEYRKKGKVGRYYGTFPAAYASAEPAGQQEQEQEEPAPLAA